MVDADYFEPLARVEDIPESGLLGVRLGTGERICLVNADGRITALADRCSHQDFPLSEGYVLPGGLVECVWHGARFDAGTGAACHLPATDPVAVYDVRVENGVVMVKRPSS
ncbi:MAG TPA: Rieske 2Fe-2S domain-containing protein [Gemmatimonadaceae bacterium]|nr:Rieske 2Fe-2S domain-containing protein [Gemmatimonadaceae bacterium]